MALGLVHDLAFLGAGGFRFEARDFGQKCGGFVLQGGLQRLIVDIGNFACEYSKLRSRRFS